MEKEPRNLTIEELESLMDKLEKVYAKQTKKGAQLKSKEQKKKDKKEKRYQEFCEFMDRWCSEQVETLKEDSSEKENGFDTLNEFRDLFKILFGDLK